MNDRSAPTALWRPMAASDLPQVEAIAAAVHPAYPEDGAVPAERLRLSPNGCFVLERQGGILGYVVSHPWYRFDPPKLDTLLGALPAPAGTWYIHDLALVSAARGRGHAEAIVRRLVAEAERAGLPSLSLVAVNGSAPFWRRHGFVAAGDGALREALASYDADAVFMVRELADGA
ncbi:MAG: GNAT family N-acetyltransferase [Bauldia sp.]|nr:MAG: GNAT family N-acetyltransferase [Bauldia sp.]